MTIWEDGDCDYASTDFSMCREFDGGPAEELPTYESVSELFEKETKPAEHEQVREDSDDSILSQIDDEPYTVVQAPTASE